MYFKAITRLHICAHTHTQIYLLISQCDADIKRFCIASFFKFQNVIRRHKTITWLQLDELYINTSWVHTAAGSFRKKNTAQAESAHLNLSAAISQLQKLGQ